MSKVLKTSTMMIAIKTKEVLMSAWMSFIYGGAIFVPSKSKLSIGDEIFLIATIPGDTTKYTVSSKVVWVSAQHQSGGAPLGFGLQLLEADGAALKSKIEALLAGVKTTEGASYSI